MLKTLKNKKKKKKKRETCLPAQPKKAYLLTINIGSKQTQKKGEKNREMMN